MIFYKTQRLILLVVLSVLIFGDNLIAEDTQTDYDNLAVKNRSFLLDSDSRGAQRSAHQLDHVIVALRDSYSKAYFAYRDAYTIAVSQDTLLLVDLTIEHDDPIRFHIYAHGMQFPQKVVYGIQLIKDSDTLSVTLPSNFRPKFETAYHGHFLSTSRSRPDMQEIAQLIATIDWQKSSDAEPLDMNWFKDKEFLSP